MVGDNYLLDVEAPKKLGWHSIYLDRLNKGDYLSIATLTELPTLLKKS